jgi:large subunit ribosomal protein L25
LLHVDFQFISMDEKITVSVPLHLEGDALGVRDGGVLQQLIREIEIEALPTEIPEEITLDISELGMGESLAVADLDLPDIDLVTDSEEVIVTIVAPTEMVVEEEEEEDEDFLEPEVIGEEEEEADAEAEAEPEE